MCTRKSASAPRSMLPVHMLCGSQTWSENATSIRFVTSTQGCLTSLLAGTNERTRELLTRAPGASLSRLTHQQLTHANYRRIDYFIVSSDFFKKRVLGTAGAAQAESKPAGKGRAEGKETPEDEDTAPASILLTNAKMSDHAAVSLAVADPESARPHRESHALAARNWKSLKPAGKSLFAMGFGKPKAPPAVAPTTGASGATPSTRKARGGAGAALGDGAAAEPAGSRAAASGEPAPRAVKRTAERSGPLAKMFAKRVRQEQETG